MPPHHRGPRATPKAAPKTAPNPKTKSGKTQLTAGKRTPGVRRAGRPSKVENPTVVETFFAALEKGLTLRTATAAAGVSVASVLDWVRAGSQGDEEYRAFAERYKAARAKAEVHLAEMLHKHMPEDPASVRFALERQFPESWARKDKLTLSGHVDPSPGGGPTSSELLAEMTDEELAAHDALLRTVQARLDAKRAASSAQAVSA